MSTQTYMQVKTTAASKPTFTSAPIAVLQRRATDPKQAAPATVPRVVHSVLNSPGQPLDASTRAFMEPRFGHDFSRVRVHSDERAAESAQAVSADAFTVRDHVVFGAGQYAPGTDSGQHLLAHELTHVVQQSSGPVTDAPVAHDLSVSEPADSFEHAAGLAAERVISGPPTVEVAMPIVSGSTGQGRTMLQRQPTKQRTKPTKKTPQKTEATISQAELWNSMRGGIIRELGQNFRDIGKAANLDAKEQVYQAFASYDENLKDPIDHEFSKILGSGASNVPQGEAAGFVAGLVNEVVDYVINLILSNDNEVNELKRLAHQAHFDIEKLLVDELAINSATYNNFEREALRELLEHFNDFWDRLGPEEKTRDAANSWVRLFEGLARSNYGIDSERGKAVIAQLHVEIDEKLKSVKTKLDALQSKYNKKKRLRSRLKFTLIAGSLAGGLIGGLAGGLTGGFGGALTGAAIGAAIGFAAPLLLELGLLLFDKIFPGKEESQKSDSTTQPASSTDTNKKTQP